MERYKEIIDLYFELKNSPESTRESYWRRMKLFLNFMEHRNHPIEEMTLEDVQQFILYLKQERGLQAGTINNYISGIRFFYTYVLEKEWNSRKVPRMKRVTKLPVIPPKEDILLLLGAVNNVKQKS